MEGGWKMEKGNTNGPMVHKSEKPIKKELISKEILDFIYEKSETNSDLLKISDFSMEFLFMGEVGFINIKLESGNGQIFDYKLMGSEAKKFVNLISDTRFSDDAEDNPINLN